VIGSRHAVENYKDWWRASLFVIVGLSGTGLYPEVREWHRRPA
jgi:hypothetical protein